MTGREIGAPFSSARCVRDCRLISDVRSEYSMQPRGVGITDAQGNTIDANVPTIIRRLPSMGVIADGACAHKL